MSLMEENELNEENVITLEPFIHQVGGRSTILEFGQSVCKPINSRELTFYETIPEELKLFVPEFRGLIEVEFNQSSDGYLKITAKPPNSYKRENDLNQKTKFRIKLCKPNGDILIENNDISLHHIEANHVFEERSSGTDNDNDLSKLKNNLMTKIHNPWVLKTFSSLKQTDNQKRRKFILLENLTSKFKFPCIMDLKMGTRQYDDSADEAKIRSQSLKVATTTSGALGLRITGVQVYNKSLGRFICHNKYFGRTLTPEGLINSFKMFLQIENPYKHNLIKQMIKQLEKLLSLVKHLNTFRFYTSSLLIIYEGNVQQFNTKSITELVDIRLIDFAHSTHQFMFLDTELNEGPDKGCIFGLNNLIKLLKDIE